MAIGGSLLDSYNLEQRVVKLSPDSPARRYLSVLNQCLDRINKLFVTCDSHNDSHHSRQSVDVDFGEMKRVSTSDESAPTEENHKPETHAAAAR